MQIKVEPSKLGHCINPEIGSVGFPLFYKDSAKDIIFRNQYPSLQLDMSLVALSSWCYHATLNLMLLGVLAEMK